MRIIEMGDTKPADSVRRVREAAVIPPYTFVGRLRQGSSPWWSPHSTYELTRAYIQAATTGTSDAGIAIMKVEGGANYFNTDVQNHVVLGSVILPADLQKKSFDIGGTVTPYDSIYLISFGASRHQDVVLQLLGELV